MKVKTTTETTYSPDIKKYFTVSVENGLANVSTGYYNFKHDWTPSELRAAAETLLQVADIMEGGK